MPVPLAPKTIGLIICSTRPGRLGPTIAAWLSSVIAPTLPAHITLATIDVAAFNLPLFDEPQIPKQLALTTTPAAYGQAHTRAWSATIRALDAYLFLTPQFNGGYPPSTKNAIDFLFWEWVGKPAAVFAYGGHGGAWGAAQLREVLLRMGVRVVDGREERQVALVIQVGKREWDEQTVRGMREGWEGKRGVVDSAICELVRGLEEEEDEVAV